MHFHSPAGDQTATQLLLVVAKNGEKPFFSPFCFYTVISFLSREKL